jgi:hypothetical protein
LWQAAGGGQLAAILFLMQFGLGISAPLSAVVERSNIHEVPPGFTGLTELASVNHTDEQLFLMLPGDVHRRLQKLTPDS